MNILRLLLLTAVICLTQAQDHAVPAKQKLSLSLECWKQGEWKAADVQTVFKPQDRLRFRFRSSATGYLYILAQSSSGSAGWLYPVSGKQPEIASGGRELIVPSADGYFVIGGPPGFDTLFWIMRSAPMRMPEVEAKKLDVPSTLISRCPEEDTSRQVACLDKNAGPQAISDSKKLQNALGLSDSLVARDLTFETKPRATEITTEGDDSNGIIYEVKIAHK